MEVNSLYSVPKEKKDKIERTKEKDREKRETKRQIEAGRQIRRHDTTDKRKIDGGEVIDRWQTAAEEKKHTRGRIGWVKGRESGKSMCMFQCS